MSRMLDKKDESGRFPFAYTNADGTDIRRLFKRIRREILEAKKPPTHQPVPIKKRA